MKPVCVPCQRFFRPKKNGFHFTEGMPIGTNVPAGKSQDEKWVPYKTWCGDLWECLGCGAQVIAGVGTKPTGVQHEADFEKNRLLYGADQFKINDC